MTPQTLLQEHCLTKFVIKFRNSSQLDAKMFSNCCQTAVLSIVVVAIFWARVLRHLVLEEARFRMRITLGVVLIRSLARTQCVPECLPSGSGVALE